MSAARSSRPARVNGPCQRCGALYYSMRTGKPHVCPNCGHCEGCSE